METKRTLDCLSSEILEKIAQNEMLPADVLRIESHLSECDRCCEFIETVSMDRHWKEDVFPALTIELQQSRDPLDLDDDSLESLIKLLGPTDQPSMLGRIANYEVVGIIGRGGMGVVFKAFDAALNRYVAIKMLLPQLAVSGAARKRFAREGQAAAAVIDDHVLPIYGVSEWQGVPYLVTQYSRGTTLQKRIQDQGPLELPEILRIGLQCARGLAAAHLQGLVHRDVKPSNILIDTTVERAMLTDFGLARTVDDSSLTRTGVIAGTPQYMSPEQARGEPVDFRSDLFSLGSLLYTMCTGRAPFRADSSFGVLRQISDSTPREIQEINPEIPAWLCFIIQKLMAKKPNDRFGSAAEIAEILQQCLAHVQQPLVVSLPTELLQCKNDRKFYYVSRRRIMMLKLAILTTSLATLFSAAFFILRDDPTSSDDLKALQGEWQLVASEQSGQKVTEDQFFNERMVFNGTKFSKFHTHPNGKEIPGESGRISLTKEGGFNTIDFRCFKGTIHGVYKIDDDRLTICLTKEGGSRPNGFHTASNDLRELKVLTRKQKVNDSPASTEEDTEQEDREYRIRQVDREWANEWAQKVPKELSADQNEELVRSWMEKNKFQQVRTGELTQDIQLKINPDLGADAFDQPKIKTYVYGKISSEMLEATSSYVEVYCLFDVDSKLVTTHVSPSCMPQRSPE